MPFAILFILIGGSGSYIAGETILKEEPEFVISGDLEVVDETEAPVVKKPTGTKNKKRRK